MFLARAVEKRSYHISVPALTRFADEEPLREAVFGG